MSSCKSRTVVTDANGNLWDLGNPNIIGILSDSAGAATGLVTVENGNSTTPAFTIPVSFTAAEAAFNAS